MGRIIDCFFDEAKTSAISIGNNHDKYALVITEFEIEKPDRVLQAQKNVSMTFKLKNLYMVKTQILDGL